MKDSNRCTYFKVGIINDALKTSYGLAVPENERARLEEACPLIENLVDDFSNKAMTTPATVQSLETQRGLESARQAPHTKCCIQLPSQGGGHS